jgi:fluoride exporter
VERSDIESAAGHPRGWDWRGARYLVGAWVQGAAGPGFPWGTFFINITGAFLIGVVLTLVEAGAFSGQTRLFVAVGVLGGYTTFSTLSFDTIDT